MLSRRRFLAGGFAALVGAILAACGAVVRPVMPSPSSTPPSAPTAGAPATPLPSPARPGLRERIGQMLLVGFRGLTLQEAEATRRQVSNGSLGGVLLFSVDHLTGGPRNVESPEQVRALVEGLRAAAPAETPLLVAIDQEGGLVARLGPAHGFPATRSAADLGRGDPEATRAAAGAMAATLAAAGINLNLAPVVDLATNPDNPIIAGVERSFSPDPDVVITHATAFIEAHHDVAGVACAVKHFPGQGSASSSEERRV